MHAVLRCMFVHLYALWPCSKTVVPLPDCMYEPSLSLYSFIWRRSATLAICCVYNLETCFQQNYCVTSSLSTLHWIIWEEDPLQTFMQLWSNDQALWDLCFGYFVMSEHGFLMSASHTVKPGWWITNVSRMKTVAGDLCSACFESFVCSLLPPLI